MTFKRDVRLHGFTDRGDPAQAETERQLMEQIILFWSSAIGDETPYYVVADRLSSDDFTDGLWRVAWAAVCAMVEDDEPFTTPGLLNRIEATHGLQARRQAAERFAAELTALIPLDTDQILSLARTLREARRRRMTAAAGQRLIDAARIPTAGAVSLIETAQEDLAAIADLLWLDTPDQPQHASLDDAIAGLRQMRETGGVDPRAIATPYADLDAVLKLLPSDQVIIAGSTAVGKSTLAVNIGDYAAAQGRQVLLFSLEMSAVQVQRRRFVSASMLPMSFWRAALPGPSNWQERATLARNTLAARPFAVEYAAGMNTTALRALARRHKQQHGLDLVIVDYLQLVVPSRETDSRANDVAGISRALKLLAMELDVCVIALSQLSRMPAQRKHGEPQLSDLRESGAIEQDANAVLLIWRHPEDAQGLVRLKIAKQRDGACGSLTLYHDDRHFRFVSLAAPETTGGE